MQSELWLAFRDNHVIDFRKLKKQGESMHLEEFLAWKWEYSEEVHYFHIFKWLSWLKKIRFLLDSKCKNEVNEYNQ